MDAHRTNVERLVAAWKASGYGVLPLPGVDALRNLESRLGTSLPEDLRTYFELTGGLDELDFDDALIGWWSLDRVVLLHDLYRAELREAEGFLVVADVTYEACLIAIQLRDDMPWPRGTVIEGSGAKWRVRATSWSAFIGARLSDPDHLTAWPEGEPDDGPSR